MGSSVLHVVINFDCMDIGTTTATLPLKPGYWRVILQTQTVLECWYTAACTGGNAIADVQEYCAAGYTGPCKQAYHYSISLTSVLACSRMNHLQVHTYVVTA
jgi:hypothetical protein